MYAIEENINQVVSSLYDIDIDPELTIPEEQFGDYSSNIALRLSKKLGKNPREIAENIKNKLSEDSII